MSLPLGGFNFNVGANISAAQQAMGALLQQARVVGAGVASAINITPFIQTNQARIGLQQLQQQAQAVQNAVQTPATVRINTQQAAQQLQALEQLAGSALRGGLRGAGLGAGVPLGINFTAAAAGGVLAAAAIEKFTSTIREGIQGAIAYNSQLEQATQTFTLFTGSAKEAQKAIEELRKNADITPFDTREVIESGQVFIRVARGSREEMMELVKQAEALAATNPFQGLQGATISIQELLGGQFESIANRFNVSRQAIHQLVAEGKSGLELVRAVVKEAGGSEELIARLGQTFAGRLSTVNAAIAEFGRRLAEPSFQRMSETLGNMTREIEQNGNAWNNLASAIGLAIGAAADFAGFATGLSGFGTDAAAQRGRELVNAERAKQAQAAGVAVPREVQQQTALTATRREAEQLTGEVAKQEKISKDVARAVLEQSIAIARVKYAAAQVTAEYDRQLAILQRQLAPLQRPDFAGQLQQSINSGLQSSLAFRREEALGDPAARADLAATQTRLDAEAKLIGIENRRAEIQSQLAEFQARGRSASELEAIAAQRAVRSIQDRITSEQEGRREALDSLQDQIRGQQELRRDALDGLRDRIRGEQEVRREALDSLRDQQREQSQLRQDVAENLRETIRLQQEQRADAKIAAQEARQDTETTYRAIEASIERAHQAQVSSYRTEIDQLREKLDATRQIGQTEAEQALARLDAQEREFQRRRQAQSASDAIVNATTIRGRVDAIRQFQELQHDQQVARQREALEQRVKAEREAAQRKQQEIQQQINTLELRARAEDRQYQQEKQVRELAREKELEAQRVADRQADRAEREQARADANAIRQQEAADRAADRAAQALLLQREREAKEADKLAAQQVREQERADHDAAIAEARELTNLERANRDADRAGQIALREAQRAAQDAQDKAQEEAYQRNLARQKEADDRAAKALGNELQRLGVEESLLKLQDTTTLAALSAYEVLLNNSIARTNNEIKIREVLKEVQALPLQAQMWDIAAAQKAQLDTADLYLQGLELEMARLSIIKQENELITKQIEKQIELLNERARKLTNFGSADRSRGEPPDPLGLGDPNSTLRQAGTWVREVFEGIGRAISEAWAQEMAADAAAGEAIRKWVRENILREAERELGIESPSKKFAAMAEMSIEGFSQEFASSGDVVGRSMFEAFNFAWTQWLMPFIDGPDGLLNQVGVRWASLPAFIQPAAGEIGLALSTPFSEFDTVFLPNFEANMDVHGRNAATQWINGWNSINVGNALIRVFNDVINTTFDWVENVFGNGGANAAVSWQNGWIRTMNGFDFFGDGETVFQRGQPVRSPSVRQTAPGLELGAPIGRQFGGPVSPGQLYRINEDARYAEFFTRGSIISGETLAREMAAVNRGSSAGGNPISIIFADGAFRTQAGSVNEQAIARRVAERVLNVVTEEITFAEIASPTPVPRTMPGAV